MLYSELYRSYASFANISIAEAQRRFEGMQEFIIATLECGEDIQIPGFLHMYVEVQPPKTFINPQTGEKVEKGERLAVKCDLSKKLKQHFKDADFKVTDGE